MSAPPRLAVAAAVTTLGLLFGASARAETLVFRGDGAELRGKIIVEFDELLFVRLDDGPARFVARSALAAIVSDDGKSRQVDPQPGSFAPYRRGAPAGVLTDIVGEVQVSARGATPEGVAQTPHFLEPSRAVTTGEASFARVLYPSGAVCQIAPESEAVINSKADEGLALLRGEVHLSSALKALSLPLGAPLSARLEPRSKLELRHEELRILARVHEGTASIRSATGSLELVDGLAVELRQVGSTWRVTATASNPGPVVLRRDKRAYELQPGESQDFGEGAPRLSAGEAWRLVVSTGGLEVRQGPEAGYQRYNPGGPSPLVLTRGDAVRTGGGGSATFVRGDGATATLGEVTDVDLGPSLVLRSGRVVVEALDAPVHADTPGGVADLSLVVLELTRQPNGMDLRATAGLAEVPLGPGVALQLEKNGQARVSSGSEGATKVALDVGTGQIVSRGAQETNPEFKLALRAGDVVSVRAEEGGAAALLLPGKRTLSFVTAGVGADLTLDPEPTCRFKGGATITLKEGLELGLASAGEHPELRFKDGTRLRVEHAFAFRVENPTIVLQIDGGQSIRIKLANLQARLMAGSEHSVASLGVRDEDRLEVSGRGDVSLDRSRDLIRFSYADRRRLWIQDGAPPVESRFVDASGAAFLTMPGVPALGTQPGRPLTVLATRDGEFIVLDDSQVNLSAAGPESPGARDTSTVPNPLPPGPLVTPPTTPPASPSGP